MTNLCEIKYSSPSYRIHINDLFFLKEYSYWNITSRMCAMNTYFIFRSWLHSDFSKRRDWIQFEQNNEFRTEILSKSDTQQINYSRSHVSDRGLVIVS